MMIVIVPANIALWNKKYAERNTTTTGAINVRYLMAILTGLFGCIFLHREMPAARPAEIPLFSCRALVVTRTGLNYIR